MLAGIGHLQSSEEAAGWVHKNLAAKNSLTDADADLIEASFRERLATIETTSEAVEEQGGATTILSVPDRSGRPSRALTDDPTVPQITLTGSVVAPASRVATKTIRLRDKEHCKFVARQPCIVCGRTPSEAHHIRFAQPRALGRKVSDEYTVPVCRLHHRELHGYGDEASWWAAVSIDPLPVALDLWQRSRA
jgi:hypothetical protein